MAESVLRHAPENEQQSFGRVVEVGVVHFVDRANEPLHERLFLVFTVTRCSSSVRAHVSSLTDQW